MASIIEIQNLTKQYRGQYGPKAVDNLNLTVEEGDIFGFVGPNGAGNTSTIRIMSTLLGATAGDIRVAGFSILHQPRKVRKVIGYMPDFFGVYNDMLVWEYLDFFGSCYHIPSHDRANLIKDLLELVDLSHRRNDPVESLSRGMKQRLSLARTLIHDPQVLILDEPASGLDPRARIEIRQLLVELAHLGKTIFFSTHILADVAEICTRVGIMEAGQMVAAGPLEQLGQILLPHRTIHITILDQADAAVTIIKQAAGVQNIVIQSEKGAYQHADSLDGDQNNRRVRLLLEYIGDDQALSGLLATLVNSGIPLLHFNEDTRDMEEVFLRATRGMVT